MKESPALREGFQEEKMENTLEEIRSLAQKKRAVILAHNYQVREVQESADFVGDSLELSRKAKSTDAEIIVFAGVRFMAETAKILNPEKKVLLPRSEAGCQMAEMVNAEAVRRLRKEYPDAAFVAYVNTDAEVKAEVDVCCTSSNAVRVVAAQPNKRIVFLPDRNLASWVARQLPEKEIIPYDGYCYVHNRFNVEEVRLARERHPEAEILVHPEVPAPVSLLADKVLSTSGMLEYARTSPQSRFIIGTEEGILVRLLKENPKKAFFLLGSVKVCANMKRTSLKDIFISLKEERHAVELPEELRKRASLALEKMISL